MHRCLKASKAAAFAFATIAVAGCAGHDNDRAAAQANTAPAIQNMAQVAVVEVPAEKLVGDASNAAGKRESDAHSD